MAPRATVEPLDVGTLRRLLHGVDRRRAVGLRVEAASRQRLGCPYLRDPLVGSPEVPERFTVALEGFDCVSYLETALALAMAATPRGFLDLLRRLRYQGGSVAWRRRNHYMTGWLRSNARAGLVRRLALPVPGVERERALAAVRGLALRRIRLKCVPKRAFWRARRAVETGDLLFFASTRRNLDVFHVGIAVWTEGELRLRHASRSQGAVVEQDLAGFLKANSMAGLIVARPLDPGRPRAARRGGRHVARESRRTPAGVPRAGKRA